MSDQNVELVERFYEAWNGEAPAEDCLAFLSEDFAWVNPSYAVDPGVRRGHPGWRTVIANLESTFAEYRHEPGEIVPSGERVVCFTHFRARPRNGPWLDKFEPHVLTIRNGSIVRLEWFNHASEAYRAAEIEEAVGQDGDPVPPPAPPGERRPLIVVACREPEISRGVLRELRREYAAQGYDAVWAGSHDGAWQLIRDADSAGTELAMVIAEHCDDEPSAIEFLRLVREAHREARTVLTTPHAAMRGAETAVRDGLLDHYFIEPVASFEDQVYPVLSELLADWRRWQKQGEEGVRVVGRDRSPETHRVCDFLARNDVKYVFHEFESADARPLLTDPPVSAADLPLVVMPDGERVQRALLRQVSEKLGLRTHPRRTEYDFVIVGGGPAGLAAAVYGASEGLATLVVEAYAPGGQAGQSSKIENYLGFISGVRGGDLAQRALKQANRFGAEIVRLNHAVGVDVRGERRLVRMRYGNEVECGCALLACGVEYRRLEAEGVGELVGRGIYYGAGATEAREYQGRHVFIVGGANSAAQAALHFADHGAHVTLVIRGAALEAGMSAYLVTRIEGDERVEVLTETTVRRASGATCLEQLTLCDHATETERAVAAETMFIFIGALPNTDWLGDSVARDERGFLLSGRDLVRADAGWPLDRDPLFLETSIPGVFAAGDVRHGSVKRVASAVGEGAMAVQLVNEYRADLAAAAPAPS